MSKLGIGISSNYFEYVLGMISMKVDYQTIQIDVDQAATIARQLYRLEGEIKALPGELDFNFWVKSDDESYILKISRPDEKNSYIAYQNELLNYVGKSSVKLSAPKAFPDIEGNFISTIQDSSGNERKVRLLSWIDGRLWSSVNPVKNELLQSLGEQAGKLTQALQDFDHPQAHRTFEWDVAQADWTYDYLHLFSTEQQAIVSHFQFQYKEFRPEYLRLRKAVVHNDANDNNVIVSGNLISPKVCAIIDYGDAIFTPIINDLAITIAYAIMNHPDSLSAALPIVRGYHSQFVLKEKELEFLYNLVAMRLIISVTKSAINKQKEPDNTYLLISEKPAWEVLYKWIDIDADFAHYSFRAACLFTPHPNEKAFAAWAQTQSISLNIMFPTLDFDSVKPVDMSVSSAWLGHEEEYKNLDLTTYKIKTLQEQNPTSLLAGGYSEVRPFYSTKEYRKEGNNGPEYRSTHMGVDFSVPKTNAIHAPIDGVVIAMLNNGNNTGCGPTLILEHKTDDGLSFFSLYGNLTSSSFERFNIGQAVQQGAQIGSIGDSQEHGNRSHHLHFQLMLSQLDKETDFNGVCYPDQLTTWSSICPDPNLLFNQEGLKIPDASDNKKLISYRNEHLGKSLSLSYDDPLKMVRGAGTHLIDDTGRRYLDTVNNVGHVGHEHPRVVRAGQQQMAVLNTNSRYLHEVIIDFAKELLDTFPTELSVVHFVNSGSEANELALRMCQAVTNEKDMIAVEIGYHGNTNGCVDISSYKFDGKGGKGSPELTHIAPLPDAFRGIYQGDDTGSQYAAHIEQLVQEVQAKGRNVAGFICESIISCGGQIEVPKDYLRLAYKAVREAGGLCVSDEVQVGCGRVGTTFWGFQLHDVVPDIVTIGKPIGNGHPLAAVVCTQKVADAFANGMEYFNTFGGNPVSCAIGREVLRVVKDENLQKNALEVGDYLKSGLQELQAEFQLIGDIRGQGLFLGFELVDNGKNPLSDRASYLANRMKELGILMSTDGKDNNVLKIKPPLVFSLKNATELLTRLRMVFAEDFMSSCDEV